MLLQGRHGSGNSLTQTGKSFQTEIAIFAANLIGHPNTHVQHGSHNVKITKRRDTARVRETKTVNQIPGGDETGSNTESWPEVDHIQSVNSVNRIDFYKAIQLVEGQPIEFNIDTGSPITMKPPIFNPKELKKTTRCFVDVRFR